jgi:hypothetical protein
MVFLKVKKVRGQRQKSCLALMETCAAVGRHYRRGFCTIHAARLFGALGLFFLWTKTEPTKVAVFVLNPE